MKIPTEAELVEMERSAIEAMERTRCDSFVYSRQMDHAHEAAVQTLANVILLVALVREFRTL